MASKAANTIIEMIPLADLIPSPDNPRVIRKDDMAIKELAASIKERGVLQPVLARPHPTKKGKLDLRAGARRHAAAKLAGLSTIPTIVRDMDDAEALEVTVTENLQREDLTPLEEARGVQSLLAGGWEAKAIADHLGKRPEWVVRRARLTKLSKAWVKQIEDPNGLARNWSAAHLLIVARLEPAQQDAIFQEGRWLFNREGTPNHSLEEIKNVVGNYTHELSKAPWKTDDTTLLPKVGACIECSKRSAANPGLFDDFNASPDKIKKGDRCLDAACWKKKEAARAQRVRDEMVKKHGDKVVFVASDDEEHKGENVVDSYDVARCKKTDKGAKPCVVLYGDNAGQTFYGKTGKSARAASSGGAKQSSSTSGIPDSSQRKDLAEAFAFAHLAWFHADGVFSSPSSSSEKFTLTQLILQDLVEGSANFNDQNARGWLAEAPLAKQEEKDYLAKAAALAIYDLSNGYKGSFGGKRSMAAKTFVIPECFLNVHLRANIAHIAKDLGVEVKSGASKAELVKAIMDANLPAGTLTKELKKAFGVE